MRPSLLLWVPLFVYPCITYGQINGYAEITAISSAVLSVGTTNETASQFTAGKAVIVMQMQDNVIGGDTTNVATFGSVSNIQKAGKYEVATILSVTRESGTLSSITLTAALSSGFNFGTRCSVQAITYDRFGPAGGSYSTTGAMTGLAWDGKIGGVLAMRVDATLTIQHNISVDGLGFRGGTRTTGGGASCDPNTYYGPASSTAMAGKGEGIYKMRNTAWSNGRGHIANGGGGGNSHNAGGAGGGGYAAGGGGGNGYGCGTSAGGVGGAALSSHISGTRVFLGGGGGGGEGNNSVSTDGARGGGIILIKAAQIATTGTGSAVISASGANSSNTGGNDGAGGAGGGGVVVLQVPTYSVVAGFPLTFRANGGNGGMVTDGAAHGGGGGGGQGAVIYSIPQPTTNITTQTVSGTGGCSSNVTPCTSSAVTGAGSSGAGIIVSTGTVLPIELLLFTAVPSGHVVDLAWKTATEDDNAYFTVERSKDAKVWETVVEVPGAGTSLSVLSYTATDNAPFNGTSYYRLKQTDLDGAYTYSDVVPVRVLTGDVQVALYPNPAEGRLSLVCTGLALGSVQVINDLGQQTGVRTTVKDGRAQLDISSLPNGGYTVVVLSDREVLQQRLVVRH